MSKRIDLTGMKFYRWKVIEYVGNNKNSKPLYKCICDCGTIKEVLGEQMKSGGSKSCGCLTKEMSSKKHTKHKMSGKRIYTIWSDMKRRCNNVKNKEYANYGGRGIKVCDLWLNDFTAFMNWAYKNGYNDKMSIDRIDVNGNYEPINCRWLKMEQQSINKRISKKNNTGIKGVHFTKGKYVVRISFKGKRYYVGAFKTFEDAQKAREEAEAKYWG